jgi:Xaa-Pro aminopeptidase
VRAAQRATSAGFAAVRPLLVPGKTAREIQIEPGQRSSATAPTSCAFDTIVGGGPNAAVLHFPPSQRPFAPASGS